MQQNPYAPPRDFGLLPGVGPAQPRSPRDWEPAEVIGIGWAALKKQWPVLVLASFLPGTMTAIPSYLPTVLMLLRVVQPNSAEYWMVYGVCTFIALVIAWFFLVGEIRIFLCAARGQEARLGLLFSGFDRFLPIAAMNLIVIFAVVVGTLALIVPGVILGLGFMMSQYYCVDAKKGPIASLSASWVATRGQKGKLFIFVLASSVVWLAGFLACCVGMYAALPIVMIAAATIYLRLSGQAEQPPSPYG
jgi:hypothetical protein